MTKESHLKAVPEGTEIPDLEERLSESTALLPPEWLAQYQDALRRQIVKEVTEKVSSEYEGQLEIIETKYKNLEGKYEALRDEHMGALRRVDELRAEARTDGLTGLYNRRFFDESLERRVSELQRGDSESLGFMIVDIDHFKQVNDVYGHRAGDEILRTVASALSDRRGTDISYRYGGEEFAIVCPNTDKNGLYEIGKRVSDAVNASTRDLAVKSEPDAYPIEGVTISIGYGVMLHTEDTEEFIKRVDEALYVSKEQGRDRMTYSIGADVTCPVESKPHK